MSFTHMDRRRFLMLLAASTALPGNVIASIDSEELTWEESVVELSDIATGYDGGGLTVNRMLQLSMDVIRRIDTRADDFLAARAAAYETGNRFWLWQRMIKEDGINGGVLNIDREVVQLHDHPGASGIVKIIDGEAEVWQYDVSGLQDDGMTAILDKASHRILKPGDIAYLTPSRGNVHALRATSSECSMLDVFIPPYRRNQRSWFTPLEADWMQKDRIQCRRIDEFNHNI